VASVQIEVHVPPGEVRYSNATVATPEPPMSVATAATVVVPVSGPVRPASATDGAVLSTRRFVRVAVCE
jgi:hypothetical protein